MSKSKESHAQTKKERKQWCGQDNLFLPVIQFDTLMKWMDVCPDGKQPVKEHIASLERCLRHETLGGGANQIDKAVVFDLLKLKYELMAIDSQLDKFFREGGPRC